jgi:hypothetical protein
MSEQTDCFKKKRINVGFKVRHSPEGLIRLPYLLQCEGNFVVLPHSGPGLILCPVERGKSEKKPTP